MMNVYLRKISAVLVLSACMTVCGCSNVPDSYTTPTIEASLSDVTETDNTESISAQPTSDTSIDATTVSATDTSVPVETTTGETTTSKPVYTGIDYVYSKIRDDADHPVSFGNISVSSDEFADIMSLINSYGKQVSFKAVSMDGSYGISYNSDKEYFAASSIKAPYLLYCYMQLDEGNGSLDEEMIYTSAYYKEGTGDIKDSPEGTPYTLREIMRRVMWNSDNSGYLMCTKRFGTEGYNAFLDSIGCENLKIYPYNIWIFDARAEDLIIPWRHIYNYFNSGTPHADVFYKSCINVKYNCLGTGLPGYTITQKYGSCSYNHVYCDAGVVYGHHNTYILSIFTESDGEQSDKSFMNKLAKKINALMDR